MTDILGPANAANAVTTRPGDTRIWASLDSWFRDCSSDTVDDGTDITANWLNGVTAALRSLWRGNGTLLDGTTPVVAESGIDDGGLWKSVAQLFQRNQPAYAVDTSGAANVIIAALVPAVLEYKAGMRVNIKLANAITGATVINLNGLGNKSATRRDGSPLLGGDGVAGEVAAFIYDGAQFQMPSARGTPLLKANAVYWVNPATGSDANDGLTSGTAFRTNQKAVTTIAQFNLNGFSVTVNVAGGTDTAGIDLLPVSGSGSVLFVGSPGTPASCIIQAANRSAIRAANIATSAYSFNGFKLSATGALSGDSVSGINAIGPGTTVTMLNIEYGTCVGAHVSSQTGSNVFLGGTQTISGGCVGNGLTPGVHIFSNQGGTVNTSGVTPPSLNVSAPVTFAGGFAYSTYLGGIAVTYSAISNPSNVTGQRFNVSGNAVINTFGSGVTYYPGTVAGAQSTGGQYL